MIEKLMLVVILIAGRGEATPQYIVRFPTEAQCNAEAAKINPSGSGLIAYPFTRAYCVFDATKEKK